MSQQDYDDGYRAADYHNQQRNVWAAHGRRLGENLADIGEAAGSVCSTSASGPTAKSERWDDARQRSGFQSSGKKSFVAAIFFAVGFSAWAANTHTVNPVAAAILGLIVGAPVPPVLAALLAILEFLGKVAYFLFKVALVGGLIALILYAIGNFH